MFLSATGRLRRFRLQELYDAALVIDPDRDWTRIRRIASRVRAHHSKTRGKRPKLVGSDDLVELSILVLTAGNKKPVSDRDGLQATLVAGTCNHQQ